MEWRRQDDPCAEVITHVYCTVKPGMEDEFTECSIANAASSVLEPDNLRFDVLRNAADPTKFMLVEAGGGFPTCLHSLTPPRSFTRSFARFKAAA